MDKIILDDCFVSSQNTLNTLHWSKRHKMKNGFKWAVMVAMNEPKPRIKKAKFGQKYKLSYLHIREKRRIIRDHDNLIAGSKILQDALRDMDFIFDDDEKFISSPIHKQVDGDNNTIKIKRTAIK